MFKRQRGVAIRLWIIEVEDAAGGEASEHRGVMGRPVSIDPLTDHRGGNRVEEPRPPRAGSFVKIPRILFKHGRQNGPADKRSYGRVGIGGAVALGITLRALPIAAESISCLLNSRNGTRQAKVDRIDGGLPRQLEFLFRVERKSTIDQIGRAHV